MQSNRFQLNKEDIRKWGKNALIFLAPTILVFIASLSQLVPQEAWYGAILLYLINILTDLFRKFIAGQTVKKTVVSIASP